MLWGYREKETTARVYFAIAIIIVIATHIHTIKKCHYFG